MSSSPEPLVAVRGLRKHYVLRSSHLPWKSSIIIKAVDGVDFDLKEGKTFALVGESGAGKTTVGLCVLGLIERTAGIIRISSCDVPPDGSASQRRRACRDIQCVFQDASDTLDPLMKIREAVAEPLKIHKLWNGAVRERRVVELIESVGLSAELLDRLPQHLSAGQRQRVNIARALALRPKVIVLDEPLVSLDVLAQESMIELLLRLQAEMSLTYLLITHDIAVVRIFDCDLAIMRNGQFVETGSAEEVFARPLHEYTRALIGFRPSSFV